MKRIILSMALLGTGIFVGSLYQQFTEENTSASTSSTIASIQKNQLVPIVANKKAEKQRSSPVEMPNPVAEQKTEQAPQSEINRQISEIIEKEVSPLGDYHGVQAYLDQLEARATSQGEVTALQVEPGLEAIRLLMPLSGMEKTLEMMTKFERRMEKLSQKLRGVNPHAIDAASQIEILKDEIVQNSGEKRQANIDDYLLFAQTLEPELQTLAIKQLESLLDTIDTRRN